MVKVTSARVVNGKIELDVPEAVDGSTIQAVILNQVPYRLTDEEREMLAESIASGEVDDGRDAFEALDALIKAGTRA